ncbi:MAG: 2-C-methyl-D-erythritol 2,4-cyclodiphosphate synthase [Kiritimatiellia bacterium]|nr:2-C-methyl-D-erythritol 2,4-cyclodiphosphate synthase [Lentisphaerota bacterium]
MIRTGIGFDVHPLMVGRRLILGGVEIPHDLGLAGHSDADVLCHAVADALLGAVADGDIGMHFPDSDPRWKDADSLQLLAAVGRRLAGLRAQVVNVDATVIAEQPRLMPHRMLMCERLAGALGLPVDRVSVKATTMERLGSLGRREGIAAMAVATVDQACTGVLHEPG